MVEQKQKDNQDAARSLNQHTPSGQFIIFKAPIFEEKTREAIAGEEKRRDGEKGMKTGRVLSLYGLRDVFLSFPRPHLSPL